MRVQGAICAALPVMAQSYSYSPLAKRPGNRPAPLVWRQIRLVKHLPVKLVMDIWCKQQGIEYFPGKKQSYISVKSDFCIISATLDAAS